MASKDLTAALDAYAAKVSGGQSSKSEGGGSSSGSRGPQSKSSTSRSSTSKTSKTSKAPGKQKPGQYYGTDPALAGGEQAEESSNPLAESVEEGIQNQQPEKSFLAEAMEGTVGKPGSEQPKAAGPGNYKPETSATSKEMDGFARWEAQRAAQQQHYKNYQDLLKEAEDLQREGQTHTQIWENGIYMGEDKEAAAEYSQKIAEVQARAQAELQASGGKKGFDSFLQAAGASGASGIWSGIMNTADAAAAKLGQGVSSPDAALPFGKNKNQKEAERYEAYGDRLKNIWHSTGSPRQKIKDTIFSTYDSAVKGTSQLDLIDKSGSIGNAMDLSFFLLRNWALPKITGSNDADANAAWLTGKAYGATDALTRKVADATGYDYLNNDAFQAAVKNSSPAESLAAQTTNVVGRMLPSILLSWVTKVPEIGLQQMAMSAAGAAAKDAYLNKGATAEQAYDIGRDAGYVEYITERMFSGVELLGKGVLSEGAREVLGDFALTKIGRAFGKVFDIGGELVEEAVSDWADPGVEKAVMGSLPEGQEDITFWQAMMGQAPWTEKGLVTLLSTLIMGSMSDIAQNGFQRVDADSVMEVVNIARNSGNERLAALADEYANLVDKRGSMGAAKFQEFAQATAERVGEEEFARQLQEQQAANTGTDTMTMFSDPATGLNAGQLALAKTPDSAAMDGMKTSAASWLTAKIAGMETGESILGDYTKPDFINQLPEGAQKVALAFANTQYAEETVQNIMNYAAEIVNGNPVEWDDSRSNAAAGYALGTLSNLLQAGEQVDQKRQQAIAAEAVEFALSGMTIDEAIDVANQSAQKTLTATPLNVQNAPEGVLAQERVNGQPAAENAAEAGYNSPESQAGEPKKRTRRNPGKGTVSFEGATLNGVTYKAVDKSKLTQKQKNQISAVKILAKATGVNIVFYETEPGESGKLKGGNGAYFNGTIYLDVNAGLSEKLPDGTTVGQTAIIRTAAHELTHFIQEFAEEDYNRIKGYIVKRLAEKQGVAGLEELVAQKLARDKTGKLTPERALDEVIADGCEMMLKDTTAIEGLFRESPGIANKIRGWLKEWTRKVSDAFEGVDAKHTEAKILKDSAEELQKMWDDALKNASKNGKEAGRKLNIDNAANGPYNNASEVKSNDGQGSLKETGRGIPGRKSDLGALSERDASERGSRLARGVLLSDKAKAAITGRGKTVVDLSLTTDHAAFSAALDAAREANKRNGWAVSPKSVEELSEEGTKVFMSEAGNAGLVVTADGDIEAVFANHSAGAKSGASQSLLPLAIANGGVKLDCYGPTLARIYSQYGFVPVAVVEFNKRYADPLWDESKGRQPVYVMMHNGDSADTVAEKAGKYPVITSEQLAALPKFGKNDYYKALEYRDQLLEESKGKKQSLDRQARIDGAAVLADRTREFLLKNGIAEEELEDFGPVDFSMDPNQNISDVDNVMQMVSDVASESATSKRGEAYLLMEGLLDRMDPARAEAYIQEEGAKNQAFANWYNKRHPSLYYKGYKPGDLFWSRSYSTGTWSENQARRCEQQKNLELQRQHLQKLLSGKGLAPEDRVSAESFLHEVEEAQNGKVVLYSERDMPEPTNTQYGFKLMNVDENGLPHAMFIDAAKPYEPDKWYAAEAPGLDALLAVEPGYAYLVDADDNVDIASRRPLTRSGKSFKGLPGKSLVDQATLEGKRWMTVYKNKAGEISVANVGINGSGSVSTYAMRPGIHAVDIPSMAHIGAKSKKGKGSKIDTRRPNQRWFLIEYPVDNDYNLEAFRNKRKDIRDHLPTNGWYSFQTNSGAEARQHWFITGGMKIVGAVSEADIRKFARDRGFEEDLPWKLGKSYNDDDALDLDNYMRTTTAKPTPSKSEMFDRIVKERNAARKAGKGPQFSDREDYDAAVDEAHNVWAPEFYSKMDQTIQKQMPNKMAASQVVGWLTGKGVKKEEIRWSGIEQFLEGKKNVTKAEVQAFMEGNKLNIETKTLSDDEYRFKWIAPYFDDIGFNDLYAASETAWDMAADDEALDESEFTDWWEDDDVVYGAPDRETGELIEVLRLSPNPEPDNSTKWSQYKLRGGRGYREILFKLPGLEDSYGAAYTHWDEHAEGVIAHARLQDMKTPDGRKVLFIEEIQSDLHNAGAAKRDRQTGKIVKEEHFTTPEEREYQELARKGRWTRTKEEDVRYDELRDKLTPAQKEYEAARNERIPIQEEARRAADIVAFNALNLLDELSDPEYLWQSQLTGTAIVPPEVLPKWWAAEDWAWLKERIDGDLVIDHYSEDAKFYSDEIKAVLGNLLDVASKDDNVDKRVFDRLREANEKVEEAAERLNKQRTRAQDRHAPPDVPFAGAADTYHEYVMKHILRLAAEGNYDAIGWTTAQQQVDRWSDEFEEGYRIEYDQNLPKFMNKYAKQWGEKAFGITIKTGYYESSDEDEVWGVEINDKMKNDVLYVGQPMFSERDEETGGSRGADVIDILTNPTGENGQLSNNQVDKIVGDPDAFQQFLQATGLQASDIDRSSKSNTRKSVKEAAAQYLADAATARRADELGRQADEWNKAHENDEREEEFDGVSEKNWDRFWNAAHKGYDALVNLIAKDAKNMADYMRIFKDATGEDMSNDPDVLRKQLQDLVRDSSADAVTGKPLVPTGAVRGERRPNQWDIFSNWGNDGGGAQTTWNRPTEYSGTEARQPGRTNSSTLNWNAPGSSAPKTSQVYANTYTRTGEAADLEETDFQYVPITERESIRRAAAKVGNNPDQVLKELYGSRIWLSEQVDAAYIIKGYLRGKALATDSKEDWAAYKTFAKIVQERGTESGRSLQAWAKQSRLNAGSLLDTIEAEVDRIRRDAESRRSRWKVPPEQIAEVEKKGRAIATRMAKLENQYDELVENGMNKNRAWQRVKGDYVKLASEIAAERMVGLMSDAGKNADIRNNVRRGVTETTTLLEKMLDSMDEDYIRKYVALSAAGITEDVKYKGKLSAEKVSRYVNTLHKQGMLASVPTTLRNLEGNSVFGTVDWAANNVAGAAMDALFGFFTGERTRGMEWGVLDPRVAKAAKTEMVKSILEIAANIDLYDMPRGSKYGTSGQYSVNPYGNIGSRIMMRAEQGLKYALESTDAFFVGASKASAGMAASRANARRGGSMTEKTAEAIGKNEAEFRTFKNVTPIQEFLQGLRGLIDLIGFGGEITNWGGTKIPIRKGGFGLGTLTVPFIGVPVNIALKAAEYSPINAALGIRTAMKMANTYADAKKTGDAELYQKALMLQNQAAGQIGRGVFGSVLVTLLMAAMKRAKKDDREFYKDWNLEKNADVRAQNKAEGKYGQQVNVSMLMRYLMYGKDRDPGGWEKDDLAVNISANEPMDQFLSMASMLADDDDAPDILDIVEAAGKGTLDSIMDLSCVASVNEFINTLNYNPVYKTEEQTVNGETVETEVVDERATRVNAAAAMLAKSLSGFVPATLRHAAAASDEYQRDTRGDSATETAWNQILNSIPGRRGRESLPVKTDNFGNPIKTGDRNTRLANTYLANSYSRVNQSGVSAELERLREKTGDVLLPPRNPPRTLTYGSGKDQKTVRLTADEGRDYHETRGQDYDHQLRLLFSTREYKNADTDTKEAMVKALKAFSNDTARTDAARDHGIQYDSKYADARQLDHPTMSVSLKAGYSEASKSEDWRAVDAMTKAAGDLTDKDREYLKKADYFGFMYDMSQKGTGAKKVNWYQDDLKERIAPAGKTQANGYDIFQTVVSGVQQGKLTEEDADNFMNRTKSDGSYYVAKGRHSVYEGMRAQDYTPEQALDAWDKMDSNGNGTLTKKEFDNALRKYKFKNESTFKNSVYKANGWGKYRKK